LIKPKCFSCDAELTEFGGLLFSPPDNSESVDVTKSHLCVKCYWFWIDMMNEHRKMYMKIHNSESSMEEKI